MAKNPDVLKILKEVVFETFGDYLILRDSNTATFEFEDIDTLKQFIDVLDMVYSDYYIKIVQTSEHPNIQIQMRLEERIWKPK